MKVAILVDGDFFLRRFKALSGALPPAEMAAAVRRHCLLHVRGRFGERLHRILFYDCPPMEKRAHLPISGKAVNFAKEPKAQFRREFHEALKRQPNVALRLGRLDEENARWVLRDPEVLTRLLKSKVALDDLTDDHFRYHAAQKGVDTRIGLDIAAMAHKRQVERVVLISGDSDFVPVIKTARREGIHVALDPMWNPIKDDLSEHIDALHNKFPRPPAKKPAA